MDKSERNVVELGDSESLRILRNIRCIIGEYCQNNPLEFNELIDIYQDFVKDHSTLLLQRNTEPQTCIAIKWNVNSLDMYISWSIEKWYAGLAFQYRHHSHSFTLRTHIGYDPRFKNQIITATKILSKLGILIDSSLKLSSKVLNHE